jgi:uncharacterized membrane protein HdeD (DUF308 family)
MCGLYNTHASIMSTFASLSKGIMQTQTAFFKDTLKPRNLIPAICGFVSVVIGVALLVTGAKIPTPPPTLDDVHRARRLKRAGAVLVAGGVVSMVAVGIMLAVRNPEAYIQQQLLGRVFGR